MTVASSPAVPRRRLLVGALAACGLGAAGAMVYMFPAVFGRRYAPTPFDDLLSKLPDRETASRIGEALLAQKKSFDPRAAAQNLRERMRSKTLNEISLAELAAGRTLGIRGWIVPESLGTLCALAAAVAPPVTRP